MARATALVALCLLLALPTALAPATAVAWPAYLAGLALIVAGLWAGARAARPPARRGWVLVAVTATMWLAGDIVQRILEARGAVAVGPQDVLWLGSYGTLAAGVVVMIRGRGLPGRVLREIRLDVTVVTAAALIPVWRFMIAPGVRDGALDPATAVAVLYPVGDLVLLALALTLVLAPGTRGAAGWLLVSCLTVTLGTDALFAVLPEVAPGFDLSRLDAVLLGANALLAAAALHPSRDVLARPPAGIASARTMHRWRVVLLGSGLSATTLAVALAPAAAAADRILGAAVGVVVTLAIMQRFYGVVRERESAEALLFHQAHHDALTGLANRSLLLDRLGSALFAPAEPRGLAVLYIDLDGFKGVNDRWGHAAGDAVLCAAAERLTARTRRDDLVARVGGDEFVVFCAGIAPDDAEALGRALREELRAPVDIGGRTVAVDASVGVYATSHVDLAAERLDADGLLGAADAAMYRAKRNGGGVRTAAPRRAAVASG